MLPLPKAKGESVTVARVEQLSQVRWDARGEKGSTCNTRFLWRRPSRANGRNRLRRFAAVVPARAVPSLGNPGVHVVTVF